MGCQLEKELNYLNRSSTNWIDSKVVLRYIHNDVSRFYAYVANRVQMIRENTDVKAWRYMDTDSKPADIASRGMSGSAAPPDVFTRLDVSVVSVDGFRCDNY